MTYSMFKKLTAGLLIGDNDLPEDCDVLGALVEYALHTVAMKADSLHLMTLIPSYGVLREAQGNYFIKTPKCPELDNDQLDIDSELIPAVARYVASYISSKKGGIHVKAAERIILDFNASVWSAQDSAVGNIVSNGYCTNETQTEWQGAI